MTNSRQGTRRGELSELIRMLGFPLIGDGWVRDDSRIFSLGPDAGT